MGESLSIKNLVTRTVSDVWNVLLGRRPESYRKPEVGRALIDQVDHALFERKLEKAIVSGVVLDKWAERDLHFECKSSAVLSSIYSVCGLSLLAEERIIKSKKLIQPGCNDCKAQYFKRLGTYYMFEKRHQFAIKAYTQSIELFVLEENQMEAGISMFNRGAAKAITKDCNQGLEDEERALELLGSDFSIYTIATSVNIAAILVYLGRIDDALERVAETRDTLKGEEDLERPKLILRWIKALLLEAQNELQRAGGMLDRVEVRMKKLDMKPELKVLYADRARIAIRTTSIERIARKAYDIEESPRIQRIIKTVIDNPTTDNILKWRGSLNAYVPPFPATA